MKVNGCLATITTRYPLSSHRYLVRISCVLVVSSLFILDDIKMFINFFPSLIVQMTKTLPNLPKHQAITIYQKVIPHHVLMFYNFKIWYVQRDPNQAPRLLRSYDKDSNYQSGFNSCCGTSRSKSMNNHTYIIRSHVINSRLLPICAIFGEYCIHLCGKWQVIMSSSRKITKSPL